MVEPVSPLAPDWNPGPHGHVTDGIGVVLSEPQRGCILQAAAWPEREAALAAALAKASSLSIADHHGGGAVGKDVFVFGIGSGRHLLSAEDEALLSKISNAVGEDIGTVTDLSHARTIIRIEGPKARWVLSKLFAVDFSADHFALGDGVATAHHEIFTQIQRVGPDAFDLYVFRSFARSFWHTLRRAAEATGYEVR